MVKPQQHSYPFYIPKHPHQSHQPMIQVANLDKNTREPVYAKPINNNIYVPISSQFDAKPGGFSPNLGNYNNNLSFSNIVNSQYRKS
jgi:hypothetical protein